MDYSKSDEREITELIKRLINIPSVTGNKNANLKALNVVKDFLGNKATLRKFVKDNVISYLFSNSRDFMKPKILFYAHLDVVDVGNNQKLFQPDLKGKILKGRGACDMKGQAAILIWCFHQILLNNKDASIALLLVTDEEVGGFNGAKYVIEQGLKPEILFLPDGGENFNIVLSEKAPHHITIEAKGIGGHASRAFELDNPLNRIFAFYEEAREKFNIADKKNTWASTFEMTTIECDNQSKNKIPSAAKATFSWRWPLEQIKFKIGRKEIIRIVKKNGCVVLAEEGWGEGTLIDEKNKYLQKWKKIIDSNLNKKAKFIQSHGASDARHFFNSKKFGTKNIIITSPICGGLHSDNEWIDINSLLTMGRSLVTFVNNFFLQ